MDSMEATASFYLWPRLSECGSIDEVLLNIKMRAQIKGIIAETGRTKPGTFVRGITVTSKEGLCLDL